MVRRYIFKKWDKTKETAKCSLCPNQTLFFITDRKTGEEWWCCVECAVKHYKIKRLKGLLKKYPIRKKKTILEQNPLIKNSENATENQTHLFITSFVEPGQKSSGSYVQQKLGVLNGNSKTII